MDLIVINLAEHTNDTSVLFIDREEFFFVIYRITDGKRYVDFYNQHTMMKVTYSLDLDDSTMTEYIPKSNKMYATVGDTITVDLPSISFTTHSFSMLTVSEFALKFGLSAAIIEQIKHYASYVLGTTTIK